MDGFVCSIHALIACFNWSGFYVDGGVIFDDINYIEINPTTLEVAAIERNPFGRATLGYELRFKSATFALEATHTSSLATNSDRGVNSVGIKLRWYPFRR